MTSKVPSRDPLQGDHVALEHSNGRKYKAVAEPLNFDRVMVGMLERSPNREKLSLKSL